MCEPSQPGSCSRRAAHFEEQTIAFDNPEQASALGRIWGDSTVPWYNLSICKASPLFLGFRLASSLPWGVLPFSPPPIKRSSNEAVLDCSSVYLPQGLGSLDLQLPSMKAPPAQLQVLNSSLEVCLMNGEPINWYKSVEFLFWCIWIDNGIGDPWQKHLKIIMHEGYPPQSHQDKILCLTRVVPTDQMIFTIVNRGHSSLFF